MFTGIIETLGTVAAIKKEKSNLRIKIKSAISKTLKPDQSVAHNGVCLTVIHADKNSHTVVAVQETLSRTNLGAIEVGSRLNLERAMSANGRFDGHLVQGHVDQAGTCVQIEEQNGSKKFWFLFKPADDFLIVEKGSVCIDGVSLTVVDVLKEKFSVVIIPFTFEHTCFKHLKKGDAVNLEFDLIGKYVKKSVRLTDKA